MKTDHSGAIIAILGATGSGKSTFADHLNAALHATAFKETIEGNPFMNGAHHKAETTFQNQLWFLMQAVKRWEHATSVKTKKGIAILDTYVPTVLLHSKLVIDAPSIQLLTQLSHLLTSHMRDPDLLVYLFDDPEYIYRRLTLRRLPCDDTTVKFIRTLTQVHESYLSTLHIPIIRIQSRMLEDRTKEIQYIEEIQDRIQKLNQQRKR